MADRMCCISRAGIHWSAGDRIIPIESTVVRGMVMADAVVMGIVPPKPRPGPGEEQGDSNGRVRSVMGLIHAGQRADLT